MIHVLHEWGAARLPSEFGLCTPEEDMTWMMAYVITIGSMRTWEEKQGMGPSPNTRIVEAEE